MAEANQAELDVKRCQEAVTELYLTHDHFIQRHGIECIRDRNKIIQRQLDECIRVLDTVEIDDSTSPVVSAEMLSLRGRALSVVAEPCAEAQELLSRAVKLDPSLVEAWNTLGEYYWKKGESAAASNCFTCSLKQKKNKVSLRNLSMVLREGARQDPSSELTLIKESVDRAREAVSLDVKDGLSWMCLGNACVALFFAESQSKAVIKQALSAYSQAERDPVAVHSADLHHNRAAVHQFQQLFALAWQGYHRAVELDPLNEFFQEKADILAKWLVDVHSLVSSKGGVKSKRVAALLQSLSDADLGGFKSKGSSDLPGLTPLSSLSEGPNDGALILGRVVAVSTGTISIPPVTCIIVDRDGVCAAVSLVNVSKQLSSVRQGVAIAIRDPILQFVEVDCHGKHVEFKCILLTGLSALLINGQPLRLQEIALHTSKVTYQSD